MLGTLVIPKYLDPRSLIVDVHIKGHLSNTLIELSATIIVMTRETMNNLNLVNLRHTPIVLQLLDRSTVKLEGIIED